MTFVSFMRQYRRLTRFSLVGMLNTVVSLLVFNGMLIIFGSTQSWRVAVAALIAYGAGITNSFFWNKLWVFRHGASGNMHAEYARFVAVSVFIASITSGAVYVLTTFLAPPQISSTVWANISVIITFPLSLLGNFFGYRKLVFNKNYATQD